MVTKFGSLGFAVVGLSLATAVFGMSMSGAATAAEEAVEAAEETFTVSYRCPKWKTVEFEDAEKAELHLKTVKKLGCEATKADHDGHLDVRYRCPKWKEIAVKDHDAAHKWEKWLKKAGFETRHAH